MAAALDLTRGTIVVVSPHLDDASLSLGATISYASRSGADVRVVTVMAGDPDSTVPAGPWDQKCGFRFAGESARARREEDARACEIMGARPVWFPFLEAEYERDQTDAEVWERIAPELVSADAVLVPGYPLEHPDHAWLTRLVARNLPAGPMLCLYVEQPYANLEVIGRGYLSSATVRALWIAIRSQRGRHLQRPRHLDTISDVIPAAVEWIPTHARRRDRRAKVRSIRAYSTQLDALGRMLIPRIRLYEWGWGGEGIGIVRARGPHSRTPGDPVGDSQRDASRSSLSEA